MTPSQQEQVEILRRIAERGLQWAHKAALWPKARSEAIDLFQHILDELERLK